MYRMKPLLLLSFVFVLVFISSAQAESPFCGEPKWYKGNLHCHSWWSDGDSPPELVVAWYKENGFHFVVLSDHNTLNEGQKWYAHRGNRAKSTRLAAKKYEERYGLDWVEKRTNKGKIEYRIKALNEYRSLFEEPGKFLLIQGEEITGGYGKFKKPFVHVNAINLKNVIYPPSTNIPTEAIELNIAAVKDQRAEVGRPMFAFLNHPAFRKALLVEDVIGAKGLQFMEIFNDHPRMRNKKYGEWFSSERLWDIVLTKRLAELGMSMVYVVGTDDEHSFSNPKPEDRNRGSRYVVVRARYLTPTHIIRAIERGDYYASTGVALKDISFDHNVLKIDIEPRPGVTYKTRFIGTMKGYDGRAIKIEKPPAENLKYRYSEDIGRVLAEQTGTRAEYRMTGNEVYVRAKVIAILEKPNLRGEMHEFAWVQPVRPDKPE